MQGVPLGICTVVGSSLGKVTAQKISFSLMISPGELIKSVISCRFGHIYWKNP